MQINEADDDQLLEALADRGIEILTKERCLVCGWEFYPALRRDPENPIKMLEVTLPKTCPNPHCKSARWNTFKATKEELKKLVSGELKIEDIEKRKA